jgi:hypothetical protein
VDLFSFDLFVVVFALVTVVAVCTSWRGAGRTVDPEVGRRCEIVSAYLHMK